MDWLTLGSVLFGLKIILAVAAFYFVWKALNIARRGDMASAAYYMAFAAYLSSGV